MSIWQWTPPHWGWIGFEGPDTVDFLQRLSTVDVRELQSDSNAGSRGCFLNPQGKIRSNFWIWRRGPNHFEFELDFGADGSRKAQLLTAIDQYTFSESFRFIDSDETENCIWVFVDDESPSSVRAPFDLKSFQFSNVGGVGLYHHGAVDFGLNWLSLRGTKKALAEFVETHLPDTKAFHWDDLNRRRILNLRPWYDAEIREPANPLELGLFDALAAAKGCYPGQEVIEKIISLGSPAQRLALIEGAWNDQNANSSPTQGQTLHDTAGNAIGTWTSFSTNGDRFVALALLKKSFAKVGLQIEGDKFAGTVSRISNDRFNR